MMRLVVLKNLHLPTGVEWPKDMVIAMRPHQAETEDLIEGGNPILIIDLQL